MEQPAAIEPPAFVDARREKTADRSGKERSGNKSSVKPVLSGDADSSEESRDRESVQNSSSIAEGTDDR